MMKRSLLLGWISLFGIWVSAQEDPVVMRINGKEIPRSEFEYSYRRHVDGEGEKLSPKEYAELFIQAKLKVEASRAAGLDTTSAFRKQQEAYRTKLLRSYLPGSQEMDGNARILYQKMKGNVRNGQVQVQQIFKYLPQTITSRHLQEEQARMDSIYQVIQNQPSIDFTSLVDRFSDDKRCVWELRKILLISTVCGHNIPDLLGEGREKYARICPSGDLYPVRAVSRRMPGGVQHPAGGVGAGHHRAGAAGVSGGGAGGGG